MRRTLLAGGALCVALTLGLVRLFGASAFTPGNVVVYRVGDGIAALGSTATAVFLDDVATFHYFPPIYYYLGRAQEGLHSANAADSYKQFLAIKANGDGDPLVADARRRIAAAR